MYMYYILNIYIYIYKMHPKSWATKVMQIRIAQNKCNFSLKIEQGRQYFSSPYRVMGHKMKKRSTNNIWATKRFAALIGHSPGNYVGVENISSP